MKINFIRLIFKFLEKYLPGIGAKYGVRIFLTPIRKTIHPKHNALILDAEIELLIVDGKKIIVRKWGQGPVVILMHGWSQNGLSLSHYIQGITNLGYCVVAPDAVGHGESEGRKSGAFAFRNTINELLVKYPDCYAMIGHSLGGLGCLLAINNHPLHIKKLITIGMPVYLEQVLTHFTGQVGAGPQIKKRMWKILHQQFGNEHQAFSAFELVDDLPKSLNYCIIHDNTDTEVPLSNAQELSLKCGALLIKTENLGHAGALKDPKTIENAIAFLK